MKRLDRLKIEYSFIMNLIKPTKTKVKFQSKLKLAKVLRLTELAGVRNFHLNLTPDFYKLPDDERLDKYIHLIHKFVINLDKSEYTNISKIDESVIEIPQHIKEIINSTTI